MSQFNQPFQNTPFNQPLPSQMGYGAPQWPLQPQSPMRPPFSVHCAEGRLVITDQFITVGRGDLRSSMMPRAALTGMDVKMMYWIPIPGMTRYRLTFRGQGIERIHVTAITKNTVKQVRHVLFGG